MNHQVAHLESYTENGKKVWEASCTCGDYRTAATKEIVLLKMKDHQEYQAAIGK